MPELTSPKFFPRWLLEMAIIFFIVLVLLAGAYFIFEKKYENLVYPNVFFDNTNLGGQNRNEVRETISRYSDNLNQNGLTVSYGNEQIVIYPVESSLNPDLALALFSLDDEKSVNNVMNFGRDNNIFLNIINKLNALAFGHIVSAAAQIDEPAIKNILKEKFGALETPAANAKLEISTSTIASSKNNFTFNISQEKTGIIINYDKAMANMIGQITGLNNRPIKLTTQTDYPEIYKKDCLNIEAKASAILNLGTSTLKYKDEKWEIGVDRLSQWLTLKLNPAKNKNEKIIVGLDYEKIKSFFNEAVAPKINQEPIDAKFDITGGRVSEFQASQDGQILDIEASIAQLENQLINNHQTETELIVREEKSKIHTANINDVGIKEIIGIGQSNFKGSPVNRRHNIKVGADSLNGLLIKPGQEFSLIKALGKIDGSTGYRTELVIKENKTIPEFGGGLCQIGTTMFRAALATGLPITARTNHSYRVVYYEPAGTDATIYDPQPDLKFINDTSSHILIQRRIEGDNLYFDFWGTTDNRIATQTKPVVYNITKPAPTKLVETLDLPVGQKKCTESAHNGADTYFDYKVTYASGEIKEKRFSSHYVPWRAVCLIGVEKLTETASTTPPIEAPPLAQ